MSKASFNSNGSGFAKTDDASGNSLFTPQFMAVLQDSLDRQGTDTLWEGPPAEEREYVFLLRYTTVILTPTPHISAAEVEMMEYAVAHCIDRLQMLERMQKTVEAALAVRLFCKKHPPRVHRGGCRRKRGSCSDSSLCRTRLWVVQHTPRH